MLKVRILGQGLIPRGYGLAPRKDPIEVDWRFLNLLLNHGSFKVQYLDPEKKQFFDVTNANAKKVYEKFSDTNVRTIVKIEEPKKVETVVVPKEVLVQPKVVEEPVVEKVAEVIPEVVPEVKEEVKEVPEEKFQFTKKNKFNKKNRHEEE